MDNSSTVKWGIVGLGWVATDFVAPAMHSSSGSRIIACVGSSTAKAQLFAKRFDVPHVHGSLDQMLDDPEVNAIYIALPNAMHHRAVLACARAGKHVLCEKPFAMTVEHAREMVDACQEARVILRIAHQIRLDDAIGRARQIVQSGELGSLTAMSLERASGLGTRPAWREDVTQSGVIFDVGVHLIDLIQWISGQPFAEVCAFTHPDRRDGTPDDTVSVLGRLQQGCQAVARATREVAAAQNNLVVEGTKATLVTSPLRFAKHHVVTVQDGDKSREERFEASPAYARQVTAFEAEMSGRRSDLPDGEDALQTVAVTTAILESITQRRIAAVSPHRS